MMLKLAFAPLNFRIMEPNKRKCDTIFTMRDAAVLN